MSASILAVTKLAIKQCFKTCYAWLLLVLSILCIVGLWGRGSEPEMVRQITLCWLPFAIIIIFGIGALWMGCSSMANDIEEKRFIGTAVAPVRKSTIWIGRWLGLMIASSMVLFVVFLLIGISATITIGAERPREQLELLQTAKNRTSEEIYSEMLLSASLDSGVEINQTSEAKEKAIAEIRSQLGWQYFPLKPGEKRTWDFSLDGFSSKSNETILIRLAFLSNIGTTGGADGILKIYGISSQASAQDELVHEFELSNESRGNVLLSVPFDKLSNRDIMRVVFENAVERAGGTSILVGYEESLQAFAPKGGFWLNLLYGYLMCLGILSIMAAMGITTGMQYSFPVAIFTAIVVMLMFVIASGDAVTQFDTVGDDGHNHGEEKKPALFTEAVKTGAQGVSKAVHYVTASFLEEEPLAKLGSNQLISNKRVGEWLIVSLVILPAILCMLGSFVLSRKEFK